jgi:hypothetical protein
VKVIPAMAATGLLALFSAAPAAAVLRTFVSATGSDNSKGNCTFAAPCATLQFAHDRTDPAGDIVVLSPGSFGDVKVTKSITIRGNGGPIAVTGEIEVVAGPDDRVMLIDLDLDGKKTLAAQFLDGVTVTQAREVIISHCTLRSFFSSGVSVVPAAGSVRVTISDSDILDNNFGVFVLGQGGIGHAKIVNSRLVANRSAGVEVLGAGNDVLLAGDRILGSVKGLSVAGGVATSFGDNVITSGDTPARTPLE